MGRFQFYISTIKTELSFQVMSIVPYFNSTLVRLKPAHSVQKYELQKIFQFYISTIKTELSDHVMFIVPYFNSTLVRLKLNIHKVYNLFSRFQFYISTIKTLQATIIV